MVGYAFSKPVAYDEPHLDYVPTQILAEAFRSRGFDGIACRSLLDRKGKNIALFDTAAATIQGRCLYQVEYANLKSRKIEDEQFPTKWPGEITSKLKFLDRYLDLQEFE